MPAAKPKQSVTVKQIGSTGYRVIQTVNFLGVDMNTLLTKEQVQKLINQGVQVITKAV